MADRAPYRLTRRERETLLWVACGKTASEISDIMSVSVSTVRSHLENTRDKLDARTITQAVTKAIVLGEINLEEIGRLLG